MHTWRNDCVRTQPSAGQDRGLRRKQTCRQDLGLPASRTVRTHISAVSALLRVALCYGSRLRQACAQTSLRRCAYVVMCVYAGK